MKYRIKFDNCQDAADALLEYYPLLDDVMAQAALEGCNDKQLRIISSFGGVQGYPTTCWIDENKNLMAAH